MTIRRAREGACPALGINARSGGRSLGRRILRGRSSSLAKIVHADAEDHGVTDGLDQRYRKLDRAAAEHASGGSDPVGDILVQLDAE